VKSKERVSGWEGGALILIMVLRYPTKKKSSRQGEARATLFWGGMAAKRRRGWRRKKPRRSLIRLKRGGGEGSEPSGAWKDFVSRPDGEFKDWEWVLDLEGSSKLGVDIS